jgi:hypothetical protein
MPEDRDIVDERDEDGTDNATLLRRLSRCLAISEKLSRRLSSIQNSWVAPGPPDAPAVLDSIALQLTASIDTVNRIKALTR